MTLKILCSLLIVFSFSLTHAESDTESGEPKIDKQACEQDNDCEVIGTGSCCEADKAVHVDYAEELTKPTADKCADEFHSCGKSVAKCKNKKCTVVNETFKNQGT